MVERNSQLSAFSEAITPQSKLCPLNLPQRILLDIAKWQYPKRLISEVSHVHHLLAKIVALFGVDVNVNVYRSPPIANESPWPEPRSFTSG